MTVSLRQQSSCWEPVSWSEVGAVWGGSWPGFPVSPQCSRLLWTFTVSLPVAWCSLSARVAHVTHSQPVSASVQPIFFISLPTLPPPPPLHLTHPGPFLSYWFKIQMIEEHFSEISAQKVRFLMSFKEVKKRDVMLLNLTVCLHGFLVNF